MKKCVWLQEAAVLGAGSVLFAMGVNMFALPGGIVFGAFTGIATVLHRLYALPTGAVIALLNLPLLVWNGLQNGWHSSLKTLVAILLTSIATDTLTFFPQSVTDPLLCAIFGGIALGVGVGLLLRYGYTTGGTDLTAWLLRGRITALSTGQLILAIDVAIIGSSALVLGDLEVVFYSIISGFAFSRVLDFLTLGVDRAKQAMIFTEHPAILADALMHHLHRGVTVLTGEGAYTGAPRKILLCVVRPAQTARVKSLVATIDPQAFLLFGEVSEVRGEGFRSLQDKITQKNKQNVSAGDK